jgi:hypothetical protein
MPWSTVGGIQRTVADLGLVHTADTPCRLKLCSPGRVKLVPLRDLGEGWPARAQASAVHLHVPMRLTRESRASVIGGYSCVSPRSRLSGVITSSPLVWRGAASITNLVRGRSDQSPLFGPSGRLACQCHLRGQAYGHLPGARPVGGGPARRHRPAASLSESGPRSETPGRLPRAGINCRPHPAESPERGGSRAPSSHWRGHSGRCSWGRRDPVCPFRNRVHSPRAATAVRPGAAAAVGRLSARQHRVSPAGFRGSRRPDIGNPADQGQLSPASLAPRQHRAGAGCRRAPGSLVPRAEPGPQRQQLISARSPVAAPAAPATLSLAQPLTDRLARRRHLPQPGHPQDLRAPVTPPAGLPPRLRPTANTPRSQLRRAVPSHIRARPRQE